MSEAKKKQIINPFGISFSPPDEKTLKERMADMPTEARIKLEKILQEQNIEVSKANKGVLYGLIYSASLGGVTAIDPKVKEAFDKYKKEVPQAFAFGEAAGSFTPLPGALAKKGAQFAGFITKKIPQVGGVVGKNISDITKLGMESSGGVMMVEAFNADKLNEAIKRNNGNVMAGLQERVKEVRQAGSDGFIFGAGLGGLAKAAKLPEQLKQKRINEIKESMSENGFRFKQRVPGKDQTEIAKVLNVPKNQADTYFETFGKEIEDTVADLGLKGNLEELKYQSRIIPGRDTLASKVIKERDTLLNSEKFKTPLDKSKVDELFEDAYADVLAIQDRFPEDAKVAQKAIDKLKNMLGRKQNGEMPGLGGDIKRTPNVSEIYDDYEYINDVLRKHKASKTGILNDSEQAIYDKVSKKMRKFLDTETDSRFIDLQSKVRALDVLKKTAGGTSQAIKKDTMPHKTFKQLSSTYSEIADAAVEKIGIDPRTLSDITGKTSIRSKTLDGLKKIHDDELNIVRGYEDRVYSRPSSELRKNLEKVSSKIEGKSPQLSTAATKVGPDIFEESKSEFDLQSKAPEVNEIDSILGEFDEEPTNEVIQPTSGVDDILDQFGD